MADPHSPLRGRRQFALTTLAAGTAAWAAQARTAQAQAPTQTQTQPQSQSQSKPQSQPPAPARATGPAQASGPIVLHGVSPRLTVHTLDTFHGSAATGLRIDFSRREGDRWQRLQQITINANGRSDEPLLVGERYQPGDYELLLHVDEYFKGRQARLPSPAFLSTVPVRIRVVNIAERIHLPIQFGPWSYTYSRGS